MVAARQRESIVAQRLREARTAAGISQRELGVRAGMDPSVASPRINQYERGKHLPDPQTLERLGRVLNCPLPFFYAADAAMALQILTFHRSTERGRAQLAALAKNLAKP